MCQLAAATLESGVRSRNRRREPLPARLSGVGFASVDVLRENTPIDAAAAAFAAATAVAAADVVASLSERRAGAASVFVLAIDGTDTDDVDGDGVAARLLRRSHSSIAGSAIGGGGGVSGWTTGAGARGRTGPVGDFRTLGRISAIAFLGMPSFGSGPIKARSKRPGSTSFGELPRFGATQDIDPWLHGIDRARGGGRSDGRRKSRANGRRRKGNGRRDRGFDDGRNRDARRLSRVHSGDRPLDEASQERADEIRSEQQQECLQKQMIHK